MLKLAAIVIVSPVIAYVAAALAFGPGRVFDALFGPAERDAAARNMDGGAVSRPGSNAQDRGTPS